MDDYRNMIDHLISKADGEVALNGSANHASMVVERMFARAQDSVKIMTRFLDPLIYCDQATMRSAADFIRSGKKLMVLVDEYRAEQVSSPKFANLMQHGAFEIRQVPENWRETIALNFSVMDDRGFRLEKDESGATAVVSFGSHEITARLNRLFDKVWQLSKPVEAAA